jgi:hypothetical protein
MGRTSIAALVVKKSLDSLAIQLLNDTIEPATVSNITISELPVLTKPSETDLRIIKCLLLSGARMEISEIAKELGISEKLRQDVLRG